MIELRDVTVEFPGIRALDRVSLAIAPGQVVGLVGQNGAGKSTLIKVLGGSYRPRHGHVRIDGQERQFRAPLDSQRAGIAVVHQELSLIDAMSVAENLLLHDLPVRRGFLDRVALRERARALLLTRVDVDAPVHSLGVGEKQLIEIARALGRSARLIILDEPTAALSDSEASALFALIRERAARGVSFLFVSHRLSEVLTLCDRVCVVRDGKLCADQPTAGVSTDDLVRAMVGQNPVKKAGARCVVGEPVLSTHKLGLSSRGRRILRDVAISVRAGERVGIFGAVGSGRTALLSTLAGLARGQVTGTMQCVGPIAFVPEDRKKQGLVLPMSVADNLQLGSYPRFFVDRSQLLAAASRAQKELRLKTTGLELPVSTLSGGNQQKILLGRALKRNPRLLLLDEPTRGVDVAARADIYALLSELGGTGCAMLFASSDADEIVNLADRAYVMRDGALVGCLEPPNLTVAELSRLASAGEPMARAAA